MRGCTAKTRKTNCLVVWKIFHFSICTYTVYIYIYVYTCIYIYIFKYCIMCIYYIHIIDLYTLGIIISTDFHIFSDRLKPPTREPKISTCLDDIFSWPLTRMMARIGGHPPQIAFIGLMNHFEGSTTTVDGCEILHRLGWYPLNHGINHLWTAAGFRKHQ